MPDYAEDFENYAPVYQKDGEKEKLQNLLEEAKTEDSNRARHILNSERWFKKRFGVRPQVVTWPWRGASNLHLPLTDKTMRRAKPNFANLIGATYPTCVLNSNILGDDQILIRGIERHFNDMLLDEDKMNIFPLVCWGIDLMLEKGRFITKVIQEFTPQEISEEIHINKLPKDLQTFLLDPMTTDDDLAMEMVLRYSMDLEDQRDFSEIKECIKQFRAGNDIIKFKRIVNLTPHPSIYVRDPLSVLFPHDTPFFISQGRWIRDRIILTPEAMEERVEGGSWNKANGEELLRRISTGSREGNFARSTAHETGTQHLEQQREGIASTNSPSPFVDEFYFFKKLPGDRLAQRMVLTIHPDHPDLPLRLIKYPYRLPDGRPEDWPFDQVQYEIISDRAYAPRGYPQILDSLQTEITNNHNAKQNWMTIANSLNLKCKRNANINSNWIPGQPLWVNRMDDAQELTIAQRDLSFDNEERILKSWAEEYIGILDQTLTNQTGAPERRTKAEVDAVSALQLQVASLDVRIFQAGMQKVYSRIWNRYMQYGPDNIEYLNGNGQPVSIPKLDIKNRLRPKPAGNINSTNRQAKASRAFTIGSSLLNLPFVKKFEMVRDILALEDERWAESWLARPDDIQQHQLERFVRDILMIKEGYVVIPRPDDDDQIALTVIDDYLRDPVKSRNFPPDRLEALKNFRDAHVLALEKKTQSTTRGGRMEQEVANVARGLPKMGEKP